MRGYSAIREGRLQRLLLGLSLVLSLASVIHVLSTPPASGYETSVTSAYSMELFGAVAVSSLLGIFVDATSERKRYWWKFLIPLFVSYLLLFCLPLFRGYALYGRGNSDVLFHLGEARTIVNTGFISPDNWYPVIHILLAVLEQFGISLEQGRYLVPLLFFGMYLGFVSLYADRVASDSTESIVLIGCALPLLFGRFHLSLHPSVLSFFVAPVFLYLLESHRGAREQRRFTALSLVFASFVLFFHPITTLLVAVLIVAYTVSPRLTRMVRRTTPTTDRRTATVFLFVLVGFSAWYTRFERLGTNLVQFIAPALRTRKSAAEAQQAEAMGLKPTELVVQFLEMYGSIAVYALLSGLFFVAVTVAVANRTAKRRDLDIAVQLIAGGGIAIVLVFYFTMSPTRGFRYLILAMTLAVGLLLSRRYGREQRRGFAHVGAIGVLLVLLVTFLAVGGLYTDHNHLTHSEASGAAHTIETATGKYETASYSTSRDIAWYSLGYRSATERDVQPFRGGGTETEPPPSLGYGDDDDRLGDAFETYPQYLFLTEHDRRAPYNGSESAYTESEHARLADDRAANKVYENGETELWVIDPADRQ
ncbi:hypothetical protein HYG81_03935 [Natrinema zhouii]|uniref:Glycosyltransferase family 39 protein n=1 Tax=Natrinema zhouii TaxID=1710539 RepID=A0A7D6CPU0_9EURY|nr:hypothetical protein [Natrinema zhouii]QLK26775.1 hypothetical protein HYG81_03935 [Natrinema zhouii]